MKKILILWSDESRLLLYFDMISLLVIASFGNAVDKTARPYLSLVLVLESCEIRKSIFIEESVCHLSYDRLMLVANLEILFSRRSTQLRIHFSVPTKRKITVFLCGVVIYFHLREWRFHTL